MPLIKGKSKKVISKNIVEMQKNPSAKTQKAARTYAKRNGVSYKAALAKIASAASYASAGRTKKKSRTKKKKGTLVNG